MVKFKLKKNIAKALVFAMAMGVAGIQGVSMQEPAAVMADTQAAPEITIDYTKFEATIESKSDNENYIFLEVLKDSSGSKVSATYCYEVEEYTSGKNGVVIDLSFLKAAKDSYIRAYGDILGTGTNGSGYSAIKTVNAQPKKIKVKYIAGFDQLKESFTIDNAAIKDNDEVALYQFKTLYGSNWDSLSNLDITTARIAGTTLLIRKAAKNEDSTDATVVGTPAGAEVKVKITAIAKAPKVAIDYIKGTVKLPKGSEYSVAGYTDEDGAAKWIPCVAGGSLTPEDMVIAGEELVDDTTNGKAEEQAAEKLGAGVTIIVRTAADTVKKKAASNPAFITLTPAIEIAANAAGTQVEVQDFESDSTATKYLTYSNAGEGLVLKAVGTAFDYSTDNGTKWKSLQAGAETKLQGVTAVTVRTSAVKPDAKISREGAFASNEVSITCLYTPNAPTCNGLVVTASSGNTVTFAADTEKQEYTVTLAGDVTFEYTKTDPSTEGSTPTWIKITSKITPLDASSADVKIWVRIAGNGKDSAPSDFCPVTLTKLGQ